MHKSDFYYSQCVEAASKSTMNFHLGAVLAKGGKIISSGHNHCRTYYDGNDVRKQGHRKPVSMHAEMHAIYSLTGMSPSFKQQVQPGQWAVNQELYKCASKVGKSDAPQAGGDKGTGLDKSWGARRRDPRVNGADLYVVRVTKSGVGNAQPCWRCVRWCAWSGVKRIFHWNPKEGRFDVTKVNDESGGFYQTQADTRLFAGAVCMYIPCLCYGGLTVPSRCIDTIERVT
ncbi:hypothetical protein EDC04DRAFT_2565105 [Pisolithus marmoratus]|nr:hypothetical protein EDC04DRAFT_2565105 [Pisolithus marmoratus]